MKMYNKKDKINIILIVGLILIYVVYVTKTGKLLYGSLYDWDCQHWSIPDYFRKLFYSTGNIFSNFAFNIGNGQNIYYLSYYGLLSPIILFSYLLPFISMQNYIQFSSIAIIILSALLFYKWIRSNLNEKNSLVSTIILIFASPILFHSHRHIMFINYIPFLIMGFMGIDKYFKDNKKSLLIVSTFLIIMSSYFYSVGALTVLVIYGVYKYIELSDKITIKSFFRDGIKFLIPIIIGVLMSSILIFPTFYVILAGRSDTTVNISLLKILIPTLKSDSLFNAYAPGVLTFFLFSIANFILNKKRHNKFLGVITILILAFPIFIYILNGTMYVDFKVLIPFVPLFVFMISNTLKDINENDYDLKKLILITFIIFILFLFNDSSYNLRLTIEVLFFSIVLFLTFRFKKKNLIFIVLTIVYVLNGFLVSKDDPLFDKVEFNKLMNSELNALETDNSEDIYRTINLNNLLQNANYTFNIDEYKSSIYSSTSNKELKDFYYKESGNEITQRSYGKLTSSRNIFYNMYVGNKYYISNGYDIVGYNLVNANLYKNEDVFPIIYGRKNLMSKKDYDKLIFPYNMEALLNYVIIDSEVESNYKTNIEKVNYNANNIIKENLNIKNKDNKYYVTSNGGKLNLKLNNSKNIVMVKFKMENNPSCPNSDLTIRINGVKNTLTCNNWKYHNKNYEFEYVISSNDIVNNLEVIFSKGEFVISNIGIYQLDYGTIKDINKSLDKLIIDEKKTKGDSIVGNINASNDEYLTMSIPYDNGFNIYIDGKKNDYEKVNVNFIGLKINKGSHDIRIEYISPGFKLGKILTFIGFNLFIVNLIIENYGKSYNKMKKRRKH